MRSRRGTATTPSETSPAGSSDAVVVVDTALGLAARREVFTAQEATELLDGVHNKVQNRAAIAQIVTSAEDSYRDTALVDRARVVDPLLDMRLVLSE
jgi:hypothetical protein